MTSLPLQLVASTLMSVLTLLSCGQSRSEISTLEITADSIVIAFESEPQIQHGYEIYRSYGCILCHGVNGEGGIRNKNAQTGEEIPSLIYIAEGYTPAEFRRRVIRGVHAVAKLDTAADAPPYAMPGWNVMSNSELDDLVIYVWSLYPQEEEDDW